MPSPARLLALCLLFWAAAGGGAVAQTVQMRSGDHARFARLVLAIPESADWRIGRIEGGYALDLQDPAIRFDPSGVFSRIPRNRLAALDPGAGRLGMELACDCHASAFLWRPDRLVIDIVDGPPPSNARYEAALDDVLPPTLPALPARPPLGLSQRAAAAVPVFDPRIGPVVPLSPVGLPDPFADAVRRQDRLAATERAILESLARAASQGLLELPGAETLAQPAAPAPTAAAPPQPAAGAGVAPSAPAATSDMPGAPAPTRPGLAVQTSVDRDRPGAPPPAEVAQDGARCLDTDRVDVPAWGDGRDFPSQIGDRNLAVAGEFDRPAPGSVEALARTYIHFGFGREARQALTLAEEGEAPDRQILEALARIVDEEPVLTDVFAGQQGCATPVALWAGLARGSVGGTTEAERLAIVLAYRSLPASLRGHLGNRLARLFAEAGDTVRAASLLAVAAPEMTGDAAAAGLTRAEVAAQTEGPEAAIAQLSTLASENPRLTAEAALRLMELALDQGRPLPPETLVLAATLRYESRGSEMASMLAAAEARVLTMEGAFVEALDLLASDLAPMPPETLGGLRSEVVAAAAGRLPDPEFLALAFAELPPGTDAAATNAVAARLLTLGFPDRASAMLSGPAEGADQSERRFLRAEAGIALGRPELVETALAGIEGPRAAQLRARALAAGGDFGAALAAAAASPEAPADSGAAWRAGAWQALGAQDDPLLRAVSDAMLAPVEVPPDTPPLAERRSLLAQAAETRALTSQLLERFAVGADAAGPPAVSPVPEPN